MSTEIADWLGHASFESIGLGQNCNASWYLKATGNKQASYPLDWTYSTPAIICDMLEDDFQAFLDPAQLIPHGMDAGHKRYHEWLFGHRNPASSKSDLEFFKRAVARWRETMRDQRPVVFLTIVLNEPEKRKRWRTGFTKQFELPKHQQLDDFRAQMDKLSAINPNCRFLFVEQYTDRPFSLKVMKRNGQALWIRFDAIGSNSGVLYLNDMDDLVMRTMLAKLGQAST